MGATVETTDGHAPVRIVGAELSPIDYELPVASAQVKSAVLLAGLLRPAAARRPCSSRRRPATTPRRCSSRRGARRRGGREARRVWPAERLSLGRARGARGLLLGRAVHRRRDARPRLRAARPRRQPQPAANGAARPARAHGRARHRVQPPPHRRRARGRPRRAARRAGRRRRRARGRSCRDRRAAAVSRSLPRWRAATASCAAQGSCARRRPTASTPWSKAFAALGAHIRGRETGSESAACRHGSEGRLDGQPWRPPDRDAGRRRRARVARGRARRRAPTPCP